MKSANANPRLSATATTVLMTDPSLVSEPRADLTVSCGSGGRSLAATHGPIVYFDSRIRARFATLPAIALTSNAGGTADAQTLAVHRGRHALLPARRQHVGLRSDGGS